MRRVRQHVKEGEAEEVEEVQASVGEAFDPCNFGGLAEHVKTHNFPEHVRTCGPCKFWKHRWKWSLQASFKNPGTGNRESWLVCVAGFAACKLCQTYYGTDGDSFYEMPGRKDKLALGTGSFMKLQNILRHGNANKAQQKKFAERYGPQPGINWNHELALQDFCKKMMTFDDDGVPVTGSVARDRVARDMRPEFILLRTLLETRESFSSLDAWLAAAQTRSQKGLPVSHIVKKCLQTMVAYERFLTKTLLTSGSVFRLQADGRKRVYQVEIGAVLWKFPVALEPVREDLVKSGCISCLGPRGPWDCGAADRNAWVPQ